jgi:hypothetical protein
VSDEKWYIVSTVRDGDTFEDDGPLGILGSWTREEANEKAERLRAKNPARCFRVEHESALDGFRSRDIIAQAREEQRIFRKHR